MPVSQLVGNLVFISIYKTFIYMFVTSIHQLQFYYRSYCIIINMHILLLHSIPHLTTPPHPNPKNKVRYSNLFIWLYEYLTYISISTIKSYQLNLFDILNVGIKWISLKNEELNQNYQVLTLQTRYKYRL
jgi:hypothetical protein